MYYVILNKEKKVLWNLIDTTKRKKKEKRILMSERKRDFNITFKGLAYVAATIVSCNIAN